MTHILKVLMTSLSVTKGGSSPPNTTQEMNTTTPTNKLFPINIVTSVSLKINMSAATYLP